MIKNEQTHDFIRNGLKDSPMVTGNIEGIGPRYCPSIEDKVVRFSERDSHQIVGNGMSPGCFCKTLKSIVRPSSLGGVPVFNRPTPKS
jgi:hypothetical protein